MVLYRIPEMRYRMKINSFFFVDCCIMVVTIWARYAHLLTISTSLLSRTSISLLLASILLVSGIEFRLLGAKRKVSIVSVIDFSSWKDNPMETRTKRMVGVMP